MGGGACWEEAPDEPLPPAREVKLFLLPVSGWPHVPWAARARFSGALAGSHLASQGKDLFLVTGGCFLVSGSHGCEAPPGALGSASQGGGERELQRELSRACLGRKNLLSLPESWACL